eukprot:TRINITY_DN35523_c0_g1_i1.p1 TRINITY_DN35523_c0_g1~~TRINITY_DN35523_c0_g1_i1.p1  ORF type:complete len:588 (-),score=135.03 TRINITY_DN35523_c0_g1_i1:63-1697(-)
MDTPTPLSSSSSSSKEGIPILSAFLSFCPPTPLHLRPELLEEMIALFDGDACLYTERLKDGTLDARGSTAEGLSLILAASLATNVLAVRHLLEDAPVRAFSRLLNGRGVLEVAKESRRRVEMKQLRRMLVKARLRKLRHFHDQYDRDRKMVNMFTVEQLLTMNLGGNHKLLGEESLKPIVSRLEREARVVHVNEILRCWRNLTQLIPNAVARKMLKEKLSMFVLSHWYFVPHDLQLAFGSFRRPWVPGITHGSEEIYVWKDAPLRRHPHGMLWSAPFLQWKYDDVLGRYSDPICPLATIENSMGPSWHGWGIVEEKAPHAPPMLIQYGGSPRRFGEDIRLYSLFLRRSKKHFVELLEYGFLDGLPMCIWDGCGFDLGTWGKSTSPISREMLRRLVLDTVEAVFCLHDEFKMLHGNICPNNIWFSTRLQRWQLRSFGAMHVPLQLRNDGGHDVWCLGFIFASAILKDFQLVVHAWDRMSVTPEDLGLMIYQVGRFLADKEFERLIASMLRPSPARRPSLKSVRQTLLTADITFFDTKVSEQMAKI